MDKPLIVAARFLVVDSTLAITDGAIRVEKGIVTQVGQAADISKTGCKTLHYDLLHPGFINAHCHLDLGFLAVKTKRRAPFCHWIAGLVAARKDTTLRQIDTGIRRGIARLIETGTTCVGDISATGRSAKIVNQKKIRGVIFAETLGIDPDVANERMTDLRQRIEATPQTALMSSGVSPHAPYSTSGKLYNAAARYAGQKRLPLTTHICETAEENIFTTQGTGPFAEMLKSFGLYRPDLHSGFSPVATLAQNGALNKTLLVHLNHPVRGDLTAIADAKAALVICPGSNRWFKRQVTQPVPQLLTRGVTVALGTDSLASNDDLDMGREIVLAARQFPAIAPSSLFAMATENGAKALRLPQGFGTLRPGAPFDAVALTISKRTTDPYRAIMGRSRIVNKVWIDGNIRYRKGRSDHD